MSLLRQAADWTRHHAALPLLAALLVVAGLVINFLGSPLLVNIFTFFCVSLMMVIGVQVFMGNSGILSFLHVGFVGVGAYVSGLLSTAPATKALGVPNLYPFLVDIQIPVLPAIAVGGLVAALIAVIIGYPLMRLSDAVAVITLFATLIVFHVIMTQWDNVTNGPRTFFGVPEYTTLIVALVAAVGFLLVGYWFRESSVGLRLRASRDDRYAAAATGIHVMGVRYAGFVLSALMGGLAGGLWAHYITSFSPKAFYLTEMFLLISMIVIGGTGSISGAVIGTTLVTVAREGLRQVEAFINNARVLPFEVYGLTELVLAVLLVLVLVWRPAGVIGGQEIGVRLLRNRRALPQEDVPTD
ncbi:MAG: branched-chain amino acid ABC transporter permease [Anaerosomatales bacterium]|nr:branched-chain amino acid ABC transporter permease [Anaerosomatales bacterium]